MFYITAQYTHHVYVYVSVCSQMTQYFILTVFNDLGYLIFYSFF